MSCPAAKIVILDRFTGWSEDLHSLDMIEVSSLLDAACVSILSILLDFLGPVVQSIVSLMRTLRVISLTVLMDSIYNILIFVAEKM